LHGSSFDTARGAADDADQVLALVLQDGLPWVVFSGSNMTEENHVFSLWEDKPIRYFGECLPRFDWHIQQTPPLCFQVDLP
jgi:hypothetical protein